MRKRSAMEQPLIRFSSGRSIDSAGLSSLLCPVLSRRKQRGTRRLRRSGEPYGRLVRRMRRRRADGARPLDSRSYQLLFLALWLAAPLQSRPNPLFVKTGRPQRRYFSAYQRKVNRRKQNRVRFWKRCIPWLRRMDFGNARTVSSRS